jgi:hypothetical protein
MKKDEPDLDNRTVWIPDSKTPYGVEAVPLKRLRLMRSEVSSRSQGRPLSVPERRECRPPRWMTNRAQADAFRGNEQH